MDRQWVINIGAPPLEKVLGLCPTGPGVSPSIPVCEIRRFVPRLSFLRHRKSMSCRSLTCLQIHPPVLCAIPLWCHTQRLLLIAKHILYQTLVAASDPCNRPSTCQSGQTVPDPDDCQGYFMCGLFDDWIHETCPNGTLFHNESLTCRNDEISCQPSCQTFTGISTTTLAPGQLRYIVVHQTQYCNTLPLTFKVPAEQHQLLNAETLHRSSSFFNTE